MISRLKDTLLLVGGADSDRPVLRSIFQSSYDLLEADNVSQARMLLEQNASCIAAVLADLPLGNRKNLRSLTDVCRQGSPDEIPLLLFVPPSADGQPEERAFALGATDVVVRPYTPTTVQRRVQVIVDLFLHKRHLETMVDEQSQTIRNTNQVMLDALSAIIEHRNTESGNHVLRIRRFTEILLQEVAVSCPEYNLTESSIGIITNAAALHDIGKISIPDSILNKPGRLTAEEFDVIKSHTTVGGQLIENLSGMGDAEYLRYAYNIALYHHERWDGGGYPSGLAGNDIPICAQVVGVADAFDALTTPRVYKPALPYDQAINMIVNGECGVFSPQLLACFKQVRSHLVELAHRYADGYSPKSDHISLPLPGPEWKSYALDSLQLTQLKNQTLLHCLNATVLEVDMDNNLCHVLYNPDPDLDTLLPRESLPRIFEHLQAAAVHPEDTCILQELFRFMREEFFSRNLRRHSVHLRLFAPSVKEHVPYELTLLRVNTGNPSQRILLAVWQKADDAALPQVHHHTSLHASPALIGLVSTALRCRADRQLTIDDGCEELYSLTGYTAREIRESFGGSLMELVFPEDRPGLADAMEAHLLSGGRTDTEFRLLRKSAPPLWVLARSRTAIEADRQEYVYFAIRDNQQIRETLHHLRSEADRHAVLSELSEGIIFDLDLNADHCVCSPRWKEQFGYEPLSDRFLERLQDASHVHPDDLPLLLSLKESLLKGSGSAAQQEIRFVNQNGEYVWCRLRARLQEDASLGIRRIVGLIYNIDEFKRATLALKERAERDSLTRLLNKTSTQQFVTEHLRAQDAQTSAMLILDLDNFKTVNDTYGHLYGDAVLSQLGTHLRSMFRSHDIVGRIGGDEFLIFLKNIPDVQMVEDRCSLLLDSCRTLLSRLMPDLTGISFSIGAALAPIHATSYPELFRCADEAMYLAKRSGKDRYRIYERYDHYNELLAEATPVSTRIDSDEQPSIADNSFIRFVFRTLYESRDLEATVSELLAHLGAQFNVSRVYIFENNDDNTTCSNTFEWCNDGIPPEIDNLQNIHYENDIPGWKEAFDENGLIYCSDISQLSAPVRAILEPQGIRSMLHCAIREAGVFRGYIGFDDCVSNRLWTQEQISLLQFLSEVMALFLLKKRSQDKAVEALRRYENA